MQAATALQILGVDSHLRPSSDLRFEDPVGAPEEPKGETPKEARRFSGAAHPFKQSHQGDDVTLMTPGTEGHV